MSEICAIPCGLAAKELKIRPYKDIMRQKHQSIICFSEPFVYVYAHAVQEKPNAADHLLPHAPTGLHPNVMQSCAGVNFYGLGKRGAR